MKELKSKQRLVAHYLALGLSLDEVCSQFGLNKSSWQQTVCDPLFKQEVLRIQDELSAKLIEKAVDKNVVELQTLVPKAITVLKRELDNYDPDSGANANTRIKAATSVLDRAGYRESPEPQVNSSVVFVELSVSKLEAIKKTVQKIEKKSENA